MVTSVKSIVIRRYDELSGGFVYKLAYIMEPVYKDGKAVFPSVGTLRRKMVKNFVESRQLEDVPSKLVRDVRDCFKAEFDVAPKLVQEILLYMRPLTLKLFCDSFENDSANAKLIKLESLLQKYDDFRFLSKVIGQYSIPS